MKPIISVENLGKRYRIQHKADDAPTNFREVLTDLPRRLFKGGVKTKTEDFWALKDVSFDIMPGERVGIIGRNGAGKSTLLKILSRITEPTTGKITMHGRVASLLEVGTGFHPELTGRENIYLNGAILGMPRSEITSKFDEIVDFAGVEDFLDVPVKRYSSGMYVRLGFAVAAHLEPEILIVDEVLAVGDMAFQKKCLGKMEEVSKGEGRTVMFVSHQMASVRQLCGRCILLEDGQLVKDDTPDATISAYLSGKQQTFAAEPDLSDQPDDPTIYYHSIRLTQKKQPVVEHIYGDQPIELTVAYSILHDVVGFRMYLDILDRYETLIMRLFHDNDAREVSAIRKGDYLSQISIPQGMLGPSQYCLILRAGIYNVRGCSYPEGIHFPCNIIYSTAVSGPYPLDTFRSQINNQLPWRTEQIRCRLPE